MQALAAAKAEARARREAKRIFFIEVFYIQKVSGFSAGGNKEYAQEEMFSKCIGGSYILFL